MRAAADWLFVYKILRSGICCKGVNFGRFAASA